MFGRRGGSARGLLRGSHQVAAEQIVAQVDSAADLVAGETVIYDLALAPRRHEPVIAQPRRNGGAQERCRNVRARDFSMRISL